MVSLNPPAIKPPALKPGSKVGLVCPASRPSSPAVVQKCIRVVEEMGMVPVVGKHVLKVQGYLAGTDAERLDDLNGFFADDSIAAIFSIKGGFGSLRLLGDIDWAAIAARPKIIVGCGDITSLLLAVHTKSNLVTFHGPNLDQVRTQYTFDRLKTAVTSRDPVSAVTPDHGDSPPMFSVVPYTAVGGRVEGLSTGGNLSSLISLMGTPFQPDFDNRILCLEDVNERNDILDRWLTTLYVSGHLARTSGVVFGELIGCGPKSLYNTLSPEDLLGGILKTLSKPSCFGLPFGHSHNAATIPIGIKTSFDADHGRLEFLESALS